MMLHESLTYYLNVRAWREPCPHITARHAKTVHPHRRLSGVKPYDGVYGLARVVLAR
jgi:hypothetical protein